jgi:hypothetical protein
VDNKETRFMQNRVAYVIKSCSQCYMDVYRHGLCKEHYDKKYCIMPIGFGKYTGREIKIDPED